MTALIVFIFVPFLLLWAAFFLDAGSSRPMIPIWIRVIMLIGSFIPVINWIVTIWLIVYLGRK